MRLLIVRHADPDYEKDSLTEKGWKEAQLLSKRLIKEEITEIYVSPLGRARDTASLTLEKLGREAVVYDWLQELPARINRPDVKDRKMIAWDWLPEDWMREPKFFSAEHWSEQENMREGKAGELYREVTEGFDTLLKTQGYVRDGLYYRAVRPNRRTLLFFCHFGLECVLLSHLLNVSPMIFWHQLCAAPSSVTTVYSEERREGKAIFRVSSFGDLSHLYAAGETPSDSARFCETFDCPYERHD